MISESSLHTPQPRVTPRDDVLFAFEMCVENAGRRRGSGCAVAGCAARHLSFYISR